jgi:hypothetical protein
VINFWPRALGRFDNLPVCLYSFWFGISRKFLLHKLAKYETWVLQFRRNADATAKIKVSCRPLHFHLVSYGNKRIGLLYHNYGDFYFFGESPATGKSALLLILCESPVRGKSALLSNLSKFPVVTRTSALLSIASPQFQGSAVWMIINLVQVPSRLHVTGKSALLSLYFDAIFSRKHTSAWSWNNNRSIIKPYKTSRSYRVKQNKMK